MAFCTSCGGEVTADAAFCDKCGASNASGAAVAPSPQATPRQQYAPTAAVARDGSAPCPNCGNFKRETKSTLSSIGKGVIALGLLPAVIGGYQLATFDNSGIKQLQAALSGVDPRGDAFMFVTFGVVLMVIGVALALGGNFGGVKVCTNCGYKFKRGE